MKQGKKADPRMVDTILHRIDEGYTIAQIAEVLEISPITVKKYAGLHNRKVARREVRAWSPEEDALLVDLLACGMRWKRIAAEMNRTVRSVSSRARMIGAKPVDEVTA